MSRTRKLVGSIIILLGIVIYSCNNVNRRNDYYSNSEEILTLLIENVLNDSARQPFYLSPILDTILPEGEIASMRLMLKLDDEDISTMDRHHESYGNAKLKDHIKETFHNLILHEKPGIGSYYYVLNPPLFNTAFTKCIIYSAQIEILEQDNIVEYQFYEFVKMREWELSRIMKRK
ncbi:MAG: hypothetical protein ABFS32_20625 [Bacteroidota bacterium]